MRNSGKALLGLRLQHEGNKTSNRCPCLLSKEEQADSLYAVMQGQVQGSGRGGELGVLPTSLVVLCSGYMCSTLLLHGITSEMQLGFWSFFYFIVHNFPHLGMHEAAFNSLQFLCILEETFIQHCSKVPGPSLSHWESPRRETGLPKCIGQGMTPISLTIGLWRQKKKKTGNGWNCLKHQHLSFVVPFSQQKQGDDWKLRG